MKWIWLINIYKYNAKERKCESVFESMLHIQSQCSRKKVESMLKYIHIYSCIGEGSMRFIKFIVCIDWYTFICDWSNSFYLLIDTHSYVIHQIHRYGVCIFREAYGEVINSDVFRQAQSGVYLHMYECMYTFMHTNLARIHTYIFIYVCIHTLCIYIYIHIYLRVHKWISTWCSIYKYITYDVGIHTYQYICSVYLPAH